jgi:hypothetical protein
VMFLSSRPPALLQATRLAPPRGGARTQRHRSCRVALTMADILRSLSAA